MFTAGYERLECTSCGFKHEKIAASRTNKSGIGLGVLLGLGLATARVAGKVADPIHLPI